MEEGAIREPPLEREPAPYSVGEGEDGVAMRYDPEKHHRHTIRLRGYDYTQAGAYFVTLCTQDREHLFGEVVDGEMRLNEYGFIVREEWFRSADIRREIELFADEFVVMPNHIHGIVWIMESTGVGATGVGATGVGATGVGATGVGATGVGATGRSPLQEQPRGPAKRSLSSFIAGFKSAAAKRINERRGMPGTPVWQRNYYEHVIRNEDSLDRIREYIMTNPLRWHLDRENVLATGIDPSDREWFD